MMQTILDVLPGDVLDGEEGRARAVARIGDAYRAVFSANATQADADLVLVDLAQFTRYYDTAEIGADPNAVIGAAHRKAVLDHILDAIEMRGGSTHGLRVATIRAPEIEE
jgi:hypothetical protein